jgi:hypothetical protein
MTTNPSGSNRAPNRKYAAGTTTIFRAVEVSSPKKMTMAIGA